MQIRARTSVAEEESEGEVRKCDLHDESTQHATLDEPPHLHRAVPSSHLVLATSQRASVEEVQREGVNHGIGRARGR
jgi:hypothetical protein